MIHRITKASLYIAAIMMFLSCERRNDNAPSDPDRIQFSAPELEIQTKSGPVDALTAGDRFGVIGYCLANNIQTGETDYNSGTALWASKNSLCPPSVFYNQPVNVTENGCEYDNPKYWYKDGFDLAGEPNPNIAGADNFHYTFFAYYPYDDVSGEGFDIISPSSSEETGAPEFRFVMPSQTGDELDATLVPDAMLAVLYDRTRTDGNLQFTFSHLLTALGFEVNNFSDQEVVVKRVTLSGDFYRSITVDLAGSSVEYHTDDTYTGSYIILDHEIVLEAPDTDAGETMTSTSMIEGQDPLGGNHLLLISGDGGDDGFTYLGNNLRVTIEYSFGGIDREPATFSRPTTFTPRPGIKYTAQLNFVGDAFVLLFTVDNDEMWEDGEADDGSGDNDDIIFE